MFGLGILFYTVLFLVNAIAILSEDRFLNRIGWGSYAPASTPQASFQTTTFDNYNANPEVSMKTKIVTLISATRTLLRLPLIAINSVVIIYELVLG
ncbi:ER to Golgi transport protein [Komagataella phaffii CBS 7435]|uniref:Integral membrane protein required for ER to Golgi transport n=2 Tax=Komagataella phaffii TaxID=460519 RepID=C4QV44_KOMPG|nr:Integral membrane protein required for ER to Golgi transport [Komagataella phaffii GS115]CAH2445769.1 ER to Golgi transport protein [Komagataella phaffii CBS 7435]CAY67114.1 Integral membrane protein required for ER to Golgi transport [Komagataella phaffii GS115]SCV11756.1 ER to Golgi transport protein [Komagataella phaffii CBS 7435]